MSRKARQSSATSIYHVILRGINKQILFEDNEDYITLAHQQYKEQTEKDRKD